jgi:nitroimidazol reductase NimA-like FMN-containing flavoprotein (pyridoxamine 5'-phosphate oxidase superfamily)
MHAEGRREDAATRQTRAWLESSAANVVGQCACDQHEQGRVVRGIQTDFDWKCAHPTGLSDFLILVLFDVPAKLQNFDMRKEIFRMDRARAIELLAGANIVHVASSTPDGEPVLRVVHAVIVDDWLLFHGAPAGEKMNVLGRRAVVSVEEVVASIPSYFVDPERACPATTFYRSVQVHGTIERIDDAHLKASMLAALMRKHQPEGGHVPIEAQHPLYRKAIEGVLVMGVRCDQIDGKAKLGQNRTPAEIVRIVELLWARGGAGDAQAVDLVLRANPHVSSAEVSTRTRWRASRVCHGRTRC